MKGDDHPQGSAVTVEPRRTTYLEWDVSPEGKVEVESVGNAAMRPPLGVTAHLCTKSSENPMWGVTDRAQTVTDDVRIPMRFQFGPKTPWFYSRSARTTYSSPH